MKKLIFTLAIMFGVVTGVSAQSPGNMWIGGSVGITSSKVKDGASLTGYKIIPEFGYVVSDNMGIGIKLGYGHAETSSKIADVEKEKTDKFTVNPFLRYSFLKGDIGSLFVDGGLGYTHEKNKTTDIKTNTYEVGFRPGVAVSVANNVALIGKFGFLGYEHQKVGDTKINTFGFNLDLDNIELGVNLVF